MPKTLLTFKSQCFNAIKNRNGASLQFAKQVETTPQGQQAAREVVVINVRDRKLADEVEIEGKEYTITLTE